MNSDSCTTQFHQILNIDRIEKIHQLFLQSNQQRLNEYELRTILFTHFYLSYSEEEFHKFFLQINQNGSGYCNWTEFVNYLLYHFRCNDESVQNEDLTLPINGTPYKKLSHHSYPIIGIRHCPVVDKNGVILDEEGTFLTTSKDGTINSWNMDFTLQRSSRASNPVLKVAKTWIVDFLVMPDVQIICTASIERDLRFYDTAAHSFQIRMVIRGFQWAINRMDYWFDSVKETTARKSSKLILGDSGGNVFLIEFNPEHRGPFAFQNDSASNYTDLKWKDFLNGQMSSMKVQQFRELHKNTITQVNYHPGMDSIFSAAECETVRANQLPSGLVILNIGVQKSKTVIRMIKGARCFAISDGKKFTVATGGADCILRLWHLFIPKKPIAMFEGHQSGIVHIFVQDQGKKIYSIDRGKCVKVWDCKSETLVQTYDEFTAILSSVPIVACYHDKSRRLIIANMSLAYCICCPLIDLDVIDGLTHSQAVSVVLYNDLFETVITCGLDDCIRIWNTWNGKVIRVIRDAHMIQEFGKTIRAEITAACLSPSKHFLTTGANDGSIKVWSLIDGACVRKLITVSKSSVNTIFWLDKRILAFSSSTYVMEFSADASHDQDLGQMHQIYHNDSIRVCAFDFSKTFATINCKGELKIWEMNGELI